MSGKSRLILFLILAAMLAALALCVAGTVCEPAIEAVEATQDGNRLTATFGAEQFNLQLTAMAVKKTPRP